MNTAEEGIFGMDRSGNITFVNPKAAKLIGWEIKELLNQPFHELAQDSKYDKTPLPREECGICQSYQEGNTHYGSNELFLKKNGTFFPIEYSSSPIWEEGKLEGAVAVFRDITKRKRIEEQVRSLDTRS